MSTAKRVYCWADRWGDGTSIESKEIVGETPCFWLFPPYRKGGKPERVSKDGRWVESPIALVRKRAWERVRAAISAEEHVRYVMQDQRAAEREAAQAEALLAFCESEAKS